MNFYCNVERIKDRCLMKLDVSKWNGAQLRKLGTLIKGLSRDEILKITKNGFRDMIGSCSHSSPLDGDALKALATRAKQVCSYFTT